jgi:hypothetical protein
MSDIWIKHTVLNNGPATLISSKAADGFDHYLRASESLVALIEAAKKLIPWIEDANPDPYTSRDVLTIALAYARSLKATPND